MARYGKAWFGDPEKRICITVLFFVPKIRFREETIMKKTNDLPRDWKQRPTLSVQLTAGVFGCTAAHIFNQIARNKIPAIKLGRRITIPVWWIREQIDGPPEQK